MKKILSVSIIVMIQVNSLLAGAPYPDTFSWIPAASVNGIAKKDQQVQNPCNCFAVVAAAEDWYQLLYSTTPDMAEQHLYSQCASAGPSTSLYYSFMFMRDSGIVDESTLLYGNSVTDQAHTLPYFGDQLKINIHFPCFAPHFYNSPTTPPLQLFYVASYQAITLGSFYPGTNNIDKLKRILLNYGPITLNFHSTLFHNDHNHAYLLYGWTTSGGQVTWYFKDSWPSNDPTDPNDQKWPQAYSTYTGDFIAATTNGTVNLNDSPYILAPTKNPSTGAIINNAVYRKIPSGSSWVNDNAPTVAFDETKTFNVLSLSIANQYISAKSATTATINNISQLDTGYTVQWSFTPDPSTPYAQVNFSPGNSSTVSITGGSPGYVTIKATITLANGMSEYITKRIFTCYGIPFKVVKTTDFCSGTNRIIQWQVQSLSNDPLPSSIVITAPWDFRPNAGVYYGTSYGRSTIPNDIFNLTYYNLSTSTSYGLIVSLSDPAYNNITDGSTQGAFESPCSTHYSIAKPVVTPNPATNTVTINTQEKTPLNYQLKMTDATGRVVLLQNVRGITNIDVSRYPKGIYFIQVISSDPKETPTIHKMILR